MTNPGNPDASTQSILPASRDANEEAVSVLDAYFRSQRIDPIIKTQSIANALLHYVDMPPTVRTLVPHENVEGQSWSKLKRGKLRILVRFAEDDQLHFHIYNRREWRRREE